MIPVKKLKNGFSMPELGFGTWKMGGEYSHNPKNDDSKDIQALKDAISLGYTAIDTAELYAGGYAEKLVGEVLQSVPREGVFLSTKVIGNNASYTAIKLACDNSLRRLKTNYIDLYYIHWRDTQFDLKEQMQALNELVDAGKIRSIGVCNFSKESLKLAQSFSKYPIVANQVHYNLEFREPEVSGLVEYCQKNDIMLVAWRPLQYGALSGDTFLETYEKKYGKTKSQIALRRLLDKENVVTLFKSLSKEHMQENLGALSWELDQQDAEQIKNTFPGQKSVSNAVPLG